MCAGLLYHSAGEYDSALDNAAATEVPLTVGCVVVEIFDSL